MTFCQVKLLSTSLIFQWLRRRMPLGLFQLRRSAEFQSFSFATAPPKLHSANPPSLSHSDLPCYWPTVDYLIVRNHFQIIYQLQLCQLWSVIHRKTSFMFWRRELPEIIIKWSLAFLFFHLVCASKFWLMVIWFS